MINIILGNTKQSVSTSLIRSFHTSQSVSTSLIRSFHTSRVIQWDCMVSNHGKQYIEKTNANCDCPYTTIYIYGLDCNNVFLCCTHDAALAEPRHFLINGLFVSWEIFWSTEMHATLYYSLSNNHVLSETDKYGEICFWYYVYESYIIPLILL